MLDPIIDVLTFFLGLTISYCVFDRIIYFLEKKNIIKSNVLNPKENNDREDNKNDNKK